MRTKVKTGGQAIIEYAVAITCVVAALLAVQFYMQRALQGRMRNASDQIGEQYDPGATSGGITTTVTRDITTVIDADVPITIGGVAGTGTLRTETINEDSTK